MTTKLFKKDKKIDIQKILTDYSMFIVVAVMIIFTGTTQSNFFTIGNASNILANTSVRFIIALGISGTLIIRGTDLSAGRIVGFSAILAGTLVQQPDFVGKFFPNLPDLPIFVPLLIVIASMCTVRAYEWDHHCLLPCSTILGNIGNSNYDLWIQYAL
ncbi:hypothetical protein MGH68_15995 [Erysipelothrix sp. D19-032]